MSWWETGAHHRDCPAPWEGCRCRALWAADARDGGDLDWYRLFYDPDYEYDPGVCSASYADGWLSQSMDPRGATHW